MDKMQIAIDKLLQTPNDKESLKILSEIHKISPLKLKEELKHILPLFLLQIQNLCFQLFNEKKFTEIHKILEFYFNLSKDKEIAINLREINLHNSLNFLLIVSQNIDETSKGLCLMIINELLVESCMIEDVSECFSVLIENIKYSENELKNLSFLVARKILNSKNKFKILKTDNEKKFSECFQTDLCDLLKNRKWCMNGLECLDVYLKESKGLSINFPELFDNKFISTLEYEHKKKLLEIKRKY